MVAQIKTSRKKSQSRPVTLSVTPKKGTIQVFTATQRSFYADVFAQALRSAAQGAKVLVVQFLQGGINQAPDRPRQLCQNLDWLRGNLDRHIDIDDPQLTAAETTAILDLWNHTKAAIANDQYEALILDELHLLISLEIVTEAEILEVIEQRPDRADITLTGANMPSSLIELADQVTKRRS